MLLGVQTDQKSRAKQQDIWNNSWWLSQEYFNVVYPEHFWLTSHRNWRNITWQLMTLLAGKFRMNWLIQVRANQGCLVNCIHLGQLLWSPYDMVRPTLFALHRSWVEDVKTLRHRQFLDSSHIHIRQKRRQEKCVVLGHFKDLSSFAS